MVMFGVGRPAIRQALSILESERLITVRRGKEGGARVHAPKAVAAARAFTLVMEAMRIPLEDLATAISSLEPLCAGLCARRSDRELELLPSLRANLLATERALDDAEAFTALSREFHERLVSGCGNATMILVAGTLTAIWSRHEEEWASRASSAGDYPSKEERLAALRSHQGIVRAIERGEDAKAVRLETEHLPRAQRYSLRASPGATVSSSKF